MRTSAEQLTESTSFSALCSRWKEDYVEKLKEIQKLRVELRRQQGDFDEGVRHFLLGLLEVLDSYQSTIETIDEALDPEDRKAKKVLANFRVLRKQLLGKLQRFGVSPIEAENTEFVAGLHKAVGVQHDADTEEGSVIRVTKQGYFWKNQILRSAEVIVCSTEDGLVND